MDKLADTRDVPSPAAVLAALAPPELHKPLLGGAAALMLGLGLGVFMHPELKPVDQMSAPQLLLASGGARTIASANDPGVGRYQGRLPEYVVGTDWLHPQPVEMAEETSLPDDGAQVAAEDTGEDAVAPSRPSAATWDVPAAEPLYPSVKGNVRYGGEIEIVEGVPST